MNHQEQTNEALEAEALEAARHFVECFTHTHTHTKKKKKKKKNSFAVFAMECCRRKHKT